jgi:AcrR family transcriptional regulator
MSVDHEGSLRERLIDVGVALVMAEGSASLGLREIARRAGVSHGAPRRYFPTHHALLSAIAHRGFADLGARFATADDAVTAPYDRLRAFARVYLEYALEHRGMFELMFRHELLDSEKHASSGPRLRESTLPLFQLLVDLVAQCRAERGAAHAGAPRTTAHPGAPGTAHSGAPNTATHSAAPRTHSGTMRTAPPPAVAAAALWSNLHGIAQLWSWGSLQLALDVPTSVSTAEGDRPDRLVLDQLVTAALDAHHGPVGS